MIIPIYEGNLPPAVAGDFEFFTVLNAEGTSRSFRTYNDWRDISPSAYEELKPEALKEAKSNLLTKMDDKGNHNISLIADIRVINESNSWSSYEPGRSLTSPTLILKIEAIAYKRRENSKQQIYKPLKALNNQ
ncbi:hypothetical protein HY212_00785 [Candidatus Pacearchaeota archaeon]|nr:hypothetical protein [Candidatus Pacearchaeota archaeon]